MTRPSNQKKEKEGKSANANAGAAKDISAMDEIDSLFCEKKKQDRDIKKEQSKKRSRYKNNDANNPSLSMSSKRNKQLDRKDNNEWVDDGLGGKYNTEGYTGRVEDGIKIFKAHILNKKQSGQTQLCPFECDCCFI